MIGQVAQIGRLAAQGEHLQAQPLVEVHVHRREHPRLVMVAGGDQAVTQLPLLVIVDEGEARDRLAAALGLFVLHEPRAHEVTHGLGAVGEATLAKPAIETTQQLLLDGEADALQLHVGLRPSGS